MSDSFDHTKVCQLPAHCPVCGRPNGCRMETGEAYKGPCWCERLTLPTAALHRLLGEMAEPRCLCRPCLEAIAAEPAITWDELAAGGITERAAASETL